MEEQVIEVDGPAPQVGWWYADKNDGPCVYNVLDVKHGPNGCIYVTINIYAKYGMSMQCATYRLDFYKDVDWDAIIPAPDWYRPIRLVKKAPPTDAEIVAEAMGATLEESRDWWRFWFNDKSQWFSMPQEAVCNLAAALKKGGAK